MRPQLGTGDVVAGGAVVDDDVAGSERGKELIEQTHLPVALGAAHVLEHAAAARAPDHQQVQLGKSDARFLRRGLGVGRLIFRGGGQVERGGVEHLDHAALQRAVRRDARVGRRRAGAQRRDERRLRQSGPRLAVGAVRLVHWALAGEHEQGLELGDDVPATGVELAHLPEESPPRAAHRVGPLARAGPRGIERGEADEERAEEVFELVEGAAAQLGGVDGGERAAVPGRKPRAPGRETRGVRYRAVFIPLY